MKRCGAEKGRARGRSNLAPGNSVKSCRGVKGEGSKLLAFKGGAKEHQGKGGKAGVRSPVARKRRARTVNIVAKDSLSRVRRPKTDGARPRIRKVLQQEKTRKRMAGRDRGESFEEGLVWRTSNIRWRKGVGKVSEKEGNKTCTEWLNA